MNNYYTQATQIIYREIVTQRIFVFMFKRQLEILPIHINYIPD